MDLPQAQTIEPKSATPIAAWLIHLMVVILCSIGPVPDVNETHYLPKARHFWDASFAPGDLFLESHDSHLFASALAGLLAQFVSLGTVAWVGRLASWAFLAWAWIVFSRSLKMPALLSPIALAAWYLATRYGHWAGEWAVGGFEAKTIAYPCVLLGLACMQNDRWKAAWVWLAMAVAWHPIVGGWAGITVGIVWLLLPDLRGRYIAQLPWLGLAVAIGLMGVVPALMGIGGEDRAGNVVASQVHVFLRLKHHLCPRTFDQARHLAGLASLLALLSMTLVWWYSQRRKSTASALDLASPTVRLAIVAWISVCISLFGLLVDLALSPSQPALASKILRFYWFRWSDIAVPLAWTIMFWQYALQLASFPVKAKHDQRGLHPNGMGRGLMLLGVAVTLIATTWRVKANWSNSLPAADDLVVNTRGEHEIDTDRYVDWLAVCAWIRENTPQDSLWFTPRNQQTFKWYAQRAEVVCWKDVPQDNASVLEWYARIGRLERARDPAGYLREWTTPELMELSREFGFQWILLDRTFQRTPPLLELMYPINIDNRSFAVFRVPIADL